LRRDASFGDAVREVGVRVCVCGNMGLERYRTLVRKCVSLGESKALLRKVGLFCGNIGLFGGDGPPLAMRSGRYVLPSSTFSTIVCVAMCCSVLQCVAPCYSVLQCVSVCCSVCSVLQGVAVCCPPAHLVPLPDTYVCICIHICIRICIYICICICTCICIYICK